MRLNCIVNFVTSRKVMFKLPVGLRYRATLDNLIRPTQKV